MFFHEQRSANYCGARAYQSWAEFRTGRMAEHERMPLLHPSSESVRGPISLASSRVKLVADTSSTVRPRFIRITTCVCMHVVNNVNVTRSLPPSSAQCSEDAQEVSRHIVAKH